VKTPFVKDQYRSAWAQYSILHENRDKIMETLNNQEVPTAIYYKIPLHLQKVFTYLGYKKGDFPVTERISKEIFSIPMHPYLKTEDQVKITKIIKNCC
jgi:dTDP-4-amino-4,6-dideoxygalactose transaminase